MRVLIFIVLTVTMVSCKSKTIEIQKQIPKEDLILISKEVRKYATYNNITCTLNETKGDKQKSYINLIIIGVEIVSQDEANKIAKKSYLILKKYYKNYGEYNFVKLTLKDAGDILQKTYNFTYNI